MTFELIIVAALAIVSLWRLVKFGTIVFNTDTPPTLKKMAWIRAIIAALILIACVLWYNLVYNSVEGQAERREEQQSALCHDVLKAYAATTLAVSEHDKGQYRYEFPLIPNPERSKAIESCRFEISAKVDRLSMDTLDKDQATFTAFMRYVPVDDEWQLEELSWDK
ncbi:MAG TPA: hypothetical protein H9906_01775 [Candidatus Paenalcaligenes intestinipullorum]|uniref:Uncharacterized protein n=1 Tax=Candidatus Paenalcaligenes intestinipullorum TaxID=2838718 RepID=A0A9D2U8X2_9BURK|nr:hypothetical protein [Candidatus Paenalcaligenes intestinipullorum]